MRYRDNLADGVQKLVLPPSIATEPRYFWGKFDCSCGTQIKDQMNLIFWITWVFYIKETAFTCSML